ncbi:hypothetical protein U8607_17530 [Methylobacterium durans]|uniref:hypothetical protein n=1 Tax=Methylobacterium durans TaxID=2202825 RepID=UPI002B001A07|nr:hypothetical protein [Methylobacterium durans]MEA1833891.1 hypothetical protein [Methylobacterium durans]
MADIDNYQRPSTLRELVSLALPIVAPFRRFVHRSARYSNCHAEIERGSASREMKAALFG